MRAVHTHLPPAARAPSSGPSCVLTHRRPIGGPPLRGSASTLSIRTYRRRSFSRAKRTKIEIVHRTSNIVHGQLLRGCLGPSCVLYLVHRRSQAPPSATGRRRPFVTTSAHGFYHIPLAPALLPRATRANLAIVHRPSYLVHRRRQPPPPVRELSHRP